MVRSAVDVSEAEGIILRLCAIVDADGDCWKQKIKRVMILAYPCFFV